MDCHQTSDLEVPSSRRSAHYYFVAFFSDPLWSLVTGALMENFGFAFAFSRLSATYLVGMALVFLVRDPRRRTA